MGGDARRRRACPSPARSPRPACSTCDEAWRLRLSNGVVARLLRGTPEEWPERYAAASPAARLPLGVPLLLVHGERDDDGPGRR